MQLHTSGAQLRSGRRPETGDGVQTAYQGCVGGQHPRVGGVHLARRTGEVARVERRLESPIGRVDSAPCPDVLSHTPSRELCER